jgi:hypothetical protein
MAPLNGQSVSLDVDEGVLQDDALTTVCTTNDEALRRIMAVYSRPGQTVADTTFGRGVFWKQIDTSVYDFRPTDLARDGIDARDLPYPDGSIDVLVFDPPYRYTPAANVKHGTNKPHGEVDALYGLQASAPTRTQGVLLLYAEAMAEALRALREGGFLVLKCQDTVQDGRNIWVHCLLLAEAEKLGFACRDMVVVATPSVMRTRWERQRHLRKGHSYFLMLRKGGHFPFGVPAMERR